VVFRGIKSEMTVAISFLIALLLSVLAFAGLFFLQDQLKTLIFNQQYTMVSAIADQLDDRMRTAQTELTTVAQTISPDLLSDPVKARAFIMGRPDTLAMFDNGVYLFSASGKLLSGVPLEPHLKGMDFSHRDYFKRTIATGKPQVTEPFISAQASRHPIIMFSAPILDRSGKVIGILGGSLDLYRDNFLGRLAGIKLGKQGYLYLLSDSRLMIVHPDRDRILENHPRPSSNQLLDAALSGFEGTGETVSTRGVELISSFKRLQSNGWILAVNLPRSEAYVMVHRAQYYLYLAFGTALALAVVVVWLLMRHLTAPLISVTHQVREITARKDAYARIVAGTGNEIGLLAEAFNTLLDELDSQKREMQLILDCAGEGIFGVDLEGRITFVNPAAASMTGYRQEELLGMHQHTILHHTKADGTNYPVEECPVRGASEAGTVQQNGGELFWRKDGSSFPVEFIRNPILEQGGPVGEVVVFKDITERVRSKEQLLKLSQTVMQNPVSVLITDLEGRIEFVNPRFTQITGYQAEEVIGQNPSLLQSGQTDPDQYKKMWETISSGRMWSGELYNQCKNGAYFWEHATISPIRNVAGAITHFMAFKEEITERKQLEAQLRHAQKMEAVGQLAGGVAHDFNNLLTAIIGFGTLLQYTIDSEDPRRRHIDHILGAAERATQLTGSLLALSRKQMMKLVATDLVGLARNHTRFLERVIGEDVTLETEFCSQPLIVHADGGQLEQVFMNLATNGRDAMPGGGRLRFKLEGVQLDREFCRQHDFGEPGAYALISISDTGIGMDQETQKKIFEPFFTTKEVGRGTGLGLSIVYGIVKQHNGQVTVSSAPGGAGTTFSVYLPIVAQVEEQLQPAAVTMPPGGDETILIAEDDPAVRALMETVLEERGYRVILSRDGQEAVELYRAHREAVDLCVFDVIMPRKNGKEACEELRQLDPGLKVLLVSGYTADLMGSRGIQVDEVDLMMKPVRPIELAGKVREMLDGAGSQQSL